MLTQAEKAALEQRSILLRRHILELVRAAKAGHIGGDMSVVDILHILYFHFCSYRLYFNFNTSFANSM